FSRDWSSDVCSSDLEDSAPGSLEPCGEPLTFLKERGVVIEQETDERLFGAGEGRGEGLVDVTALHGPCEEGRDRRVDVTGQTGDIKRTDPGLHQRPGDRFTSRSRPYHGHAVPGDRLNEVDLPERKERP